jgi:hypothetical protein
MKKIFYLLGFILLNTLTLASIHAQQSFSGGDESKQNPYQIMLEDDLKLVRDFCGEARAGDHFRLMNDIDPSSTWLLAIGNSADNQFTGYFHGGGHKITGLKMNERSNNNAGLFGYSAGTIDGMYIEGTEIKGGQYVGGLVGYNTGTIIFCHVKIDVDGHSNPAAAFVGGIAGYNKGTIESSSAVGDVTSSGSTAAHDSTPSVSSIRRAELLQAHCRQNTVRSLHCPSRNKAVILLTDGIRQMTVKDIHIARQ